MSMELDKSKYVFNDLEKKYLNFYAPSFSVLVEGTDLIKQGVGITSVKVDTSVDQADSLSFVVTNAFDIVKREFNWLDDYLAAGKYVEVKAGYVDKLKTVFYGLITSVKFDFPQEGTPKVNVNALDITFLMTKGIKSRSWTEKKISDVVKTIVSEYMKVKSNKVDDTGTVYKIIEQSRQSDYDFIKEKAQEHNYEFFITGKTLYFRQPHKSKTSVLTLEWGKNLKSFSPEIDIADQVTEVVVRGYDEINQEEIESNSKDIEKMESDAETGQDILKKVCGSGVKEYYYENVSSEKEAQDRATAILNDKAMSFITGNGETIGIPEIRAGRYITMNGLGAKLSQLYYITSATHTIDSSGYSTSFSVGGNAI